MHFFFKFDNWKKEGLSADIWKTKFATMYFIISFEPEKKTYPIFF